MTVDEDMRRLEELTVSRLLEPLSTDEAEEYAELQARVERFDEAAIENVVALAHVCVLPSAGAAPRSLLTAVEKDADEFFGNPSARGPTLNGPPPRSKPHAGSSAGWWVALAASVVAVFVLLHRQPRPSDPVAASTRPQTAPVAAASLARPAPPAPAKVETQPVAPADVTPDISSEWRAFVASHPHALQRAWRPGNDPMGERVMGDVVWDENSQTGYMRFVNLRHNEPNAEQYQLWIFDATRDERYPVDGGVFNVVARDGEQIVRIHTQLRVRVPLVFAVTVEHPGGVVVSDRSRIAAIANVT